MAKYGVSVVLLEKQFLTFAEAAQHVETIINFEPTAIIEITTINS
jgi:hypothetical protein